MKNETKLKMICFGVLFFIIALLGLGIWLQDYQEKENSRLPARPETTVLIAPDHFAGTDLIVTRYEGGIHVVTRKRVPPVGETVLNDLGWINTKGR